MTATNPRSWRSQKPSAARGEEKQPTPDVDMTTDALVPVDDAGDARMEKEIFCYLAIE